jgi:putative transposase
MLEGDHRGSCSVVSPGGQTSHNWNFLASFSQPGGSMRTSKFSESQIVSILRQADAGVPVKDLCRQVGISSATYYQWKSKYGGLEASELRRVKELEAENAKLKRMYAEAALDNAALKDLIAKKIGNS